MQSADAGTFGNCQGKGERIDMNTGLEGKYILKNNQKMAYGYTTGSCAAAAAKAAAIMLFTKERISKVRLMTPKGFELNLEVLEANITKENVCCAVRKNAGDDPDVTNGVLVFAKVWCGESGTRNSVHILGGIGVGQVTKPGLEQKVGEPAINRVPREMITREVSQICDENDYHGEIYVEISIPAGVELAKKTFNPRLGIEGGISVLGTSGIVEPMSEAALIASIRLEMQMKRNNGAKILFAAPGNYGTAYLKEKMQLDIEKSVKCSNFVGETVDMAIELGYQGILFVSHIGKFVKLAGGIMNTHSRNADCRMEIMAAHAVMAGADTEVLKQILQAITTDEALKILEENNLLEQTMKGIMEKILYYLNHRAYDKLKFGILVFSNEFGELGRIGAVEELIEDIQKVEGGKEE